MTKENPILYIEAVDEDGEEVKMQYRVDISIIGDVIKQKIEELKIPEGGVKFIEVGGNMRFR